MSKKSRLIRGTPVALALSVALTIGSPPSFASSLPNECSIIHYEFCGTPPPPKIGNLAVLAQAPMIRPPPIRPPQTGQPKLPPPQTPRKPPSHK